MEYREERLDLFSCSSEYYLAHCISSDFALGKGIAVEFNTRFDMRNKLISNYYPDLLNYYLSHGFSGRCIQVDRVFNLVTKLKYWNKPTLQSLEESLYEMKFLIVSQQVKKLAMPRIGCGLDRLNWDEVSNLIQRIFTDVDIEILVCYQ
jgi:hypothetical protein